MFQESFVHKISLLILLLECEVTLVLLFSNTAPRALKDRASTYQCAVAGTVCQKCQVFDCRPFHWTLNLLEVAKEPCETFCNAALELSIHLDHTFVI